MSTLKLNKDKTEQAEKEPSNTVEVKTEEKPVKLKSGNSLPGGCFGLVESLRTSYLATTPAGTPFEDVLEPEYWRNYSNQIKPFDHIEIRAEDGVYWAELLVLDVGHGYASVDVINQKELSTVKQESVDLLGCTCEWGGTIDKYRIKRKTDKTILSKGHSSMAIALAWLTQNSKAA